MASHEPRWTVLTVAAAFILFTTRRLGWPEILGLLFIVWAALSLLWSPDPAQGALNLQSMICLWAVFVFFRQRVERLPVWVMPLCVLGAIGLQYWWPSNYGGFGNQNWIAEWLLIAVPLCFLHRYLGLTVGALASAHLAFENTSMLPLFVVASAVAIQLARVRWWALAPALSALAGAPFLFQEFFKDALGSVFTRLEISYNSLVLWTQHPLGGVGAGGYNYAYHSVQEAHFSWLGHGSALKNGHYYVGFAHNEPVQLLSEYGLVGAALMAAFLFAALRGAKAGPYSLALASAALISLVAFPVQNPGTAVLIAASLGMATKDWRVCPGIIPSRIRLSGAACRGGL